MSILFHCCCGPCATACLETLRQEELNPVLFWYNPNIHPYTEYTNRRDSLKKLAASENLQAQIIDEYGLQEFLSIVDGNFDNGQKSVSQQRCRLCYRMRLEKTAITACSQGYRAFSTSLLASPYQLHDEIRKTGEEMVAKYKVEFLYRDFRPNFREAQNKARSIGLYMQKYCGCIFSEEERYK